MNLILSAINKSFTGEEITQEEIDILKSYFKTMCPDCSLTDADNNTWLKENLIATIRNGFKIRFGIE